MPVPVLLVIAAAFFGLIFLVNNLFKALANRRQVTFWETLLAFLTAILISVALIVNYLAIVPTPELDAAASVGLPAESRIVALLALTDPDPIIDQAALLGGAILAGVSLLVALIEVLRPPRLARSRGVLGIFTGLLIIISGLGVPFAATYLSLDVPTAVPPAPSTPIAAAATQPAATSAPQASQMPDQTAAPEAAATDDPASAERFRQLFRAVRDVLADEVGIDEVDLFMQLDAGVPLSEIVAANGGSVRDVIRRISEIMQQGIRDSIARGEISALEGALIISQMDTFVTIAVNSNLNDLGRRFGGPTPTGTRPSLMLLLTETPIAGVSAPATTAAPQATATMAPTSTLAATATPQPTSTATSTPAPTRTPSVTPQPTEARTLPPTVTPRPPIEALLTPDSAAPTATPIAADALGSSASATPTSAPPTSAPLMTCISTTAYNLRLRALPSTDADTLDTIPFSTAILLSFRTSDSAWWQTEYNGQTGWVDGEFLLLGQACANLPIR